MPADSGATIPMSASGATPENRCAVRQVGAGRAARLGRRGADDVDAASRALVARQAWHDATPRDLFVALALACREMLIERWFATQDRVRAADAKRVYYLSVEFLIGRSLETIAPESRRCSTRSSAAPAPRRRLGSRWSSAEPDAALGNGGLGRLAACFLDSLATLDLPGFGYGINYDYGLFRQAIEDGQQREHPEGWQRPGSPWLIERPERACLVPVYGRAGRRPRDGEPADWHDFRVIVGVPHDLPVVGLGGRTVNHLRLYSARSPDEFDIDIFNRGDYLRAFERKLAHRAHLEGALPLGLERGGPRAAAAPGVLLRRLRAARHLRASYRETPRQLGRAARQGGDPPERHAPGARRRRVRPVAGGRPRRCPSTARSSSRADASPTPTTR